MLRAMFAIIDKLGGDDGVLDILNRGSGPDRKKPVTRFAIIKWRTNRNIPPRCKWILQKAATERDIAFSMSDFEAASDEEQAA